MVSGAQLRVRLTEVVRDNHDTTLELLDSAGQGIDRRHVQVIRRLIKEKDVRVLHCEL